MRDSARSSDGLAMDEMSGEVGEVRMDEDAKDREDFLLFSRV